MMTPNAATALRLWKTQEVAEMLGMSREQVWRLWSSGRLPGYKLDRHLRFAEIDVRSFLATNYSGNRAAATPQRARRRRGTSAVSSEYERL